MNGRKKNKKKQKKTLETLFMGWSEAFLSHLVCAYDANDAFCALIAAEIHTQGREI